MTVIQKQHGTLRLSVAICAFLIFMAMPLTGHVFESDVTRGPGDVKTGYESTGYETRSISVLQRTGKAADLLRVVESPLGSAADTYSKGQPDYTKKSSAWQKTVL